MESSLSKSTQGKIISTNLYTERGRGEEIGWERGGGGCIYKNSYEMYLSSGTLRIKPGSSFLLEILNAPVVFSMLTTTK